MIGPDFVNLNFLFQRDSSSPAPSPHIPCPASPLNVPHLGFRLRREQQLQDQPISAASQVQDPPTMMTSQQPPTTQTTPKVISSPIRVPVPPVSLHPGLKRSHFSNLAQYLSGSAASPPPTAADAASHPSLASHASHASHVGVGVSETSKRRKTPPKKKSDPMSMSMPVSASFFGLQPNPNSNPTPPPQHYSGSTSSLTDSPASPPLSHSTEGEGPLEICEESDR